MQREEISTRVEIVVSWSDSRDQILVFPDYRDQKLIFPDFADKDNVSTTVATEGKLAAAVEKLFATVEKIVDVVKRINRGMVEKLVAVV